MVPIIHNIISTDHCRIDYFGNQNNSEKLLFTFVGLSNTDLGGTGFGGVFAINNGFDLIAIKTNLEDWYKSLTSETFDRIEAFIGETGKRYSWRATYGSSMGGYAGIVFSPFIRANVVFAISPQFDIAQSWDKRWAAQAERIKPLPVLSPDRVAPGCRYVIAYDPLDLDRLHYDHYAAVIPEGMLHPVKVFYAGHPVGPYLNAVGVLKEMAASVLAGDMPQSIAAGRRKNRGAYPAYFFALAGHCQRRRKWPWARSLILKAIALEPLNAEFNSRAAAIMEASGDLDRAISHMAAAAVILPQHPHIVAGLARLLHRKGLNAAALHHMELAVRLLPDNAYFPQLLSEIKKAAGR